MIVASAVVPGPASVVVDASALAAVLFAEPAGALMQEKLRDTRLIAPAARLDADARALLVRAADRLSLSARSYHRVLRVARTIADLDDADAVTRGHIAEALHFRPVADGAVAGGASATRADTLP